MKRNTKKGLQALNDIPGLFKLSEKYNNSENETESAYTAIPIPADSDEKSRNAQIYEMRKIKPSQHRFFTIFGAKDVGQFAAQAQFMAQFEYPYAKEVPFTYYKPVYADMSMEQLRYYFFWRTNVRNGIITKTSLSYVYVYIYELINLIGTDGQTQAFQRLASFWLRYREYDAGIDSSLKTWMKDFYICHTFSVSFKKLMIQYNLQSIYPDIFVNSSDDKLYARLYQLSDYELKKSKFVEGRGKKKKLAFIEKCFFLVIRYADVLMEIYGSSLKEAVKSESSNRTREYEPFKGAIYQQIPQEKRKVYIDTDEYYRYNGEKWFSNVESVSSFHYKIPAFIGFIVKKTEAALRTVSGYKYKLAPKVDVLISRSISDREFYQKEGITLKRVLLDSHLNEIIKEIVQSCFSQSLKGGSPSFDASCIDMQNLNIPLCRSLSHKTSLEPYASFIRMRKIKDTDDYNNNDPYSYISYHSNRLEREVTTFCKQAEVLKGLTDDFDEVFDLSVSIPLFDNMSNEQLRTYVTWRTRYKSGTVVPIPHAYITLYAFEVINGIEAHSAVEVLEKLSALLNAYSGDKYIERDMAALIQDYFICNEIDGSFSELALRYNIENYYPSVFYGNGEIKNPLVFYGKISSYKITSSKFCTDENLDMLNQCLRECLKRISAFFGENHIDFREIVMLKNTNDSWWRPCKNIVYKLPEIKRKKTVKISTFDVYTFSHFEWSCESASRLDMAASHLTGYILKRMESKMREIVKFKYKLTADAEGMAKKISSGTKNQIKIAKLMRKKEFTDIIDKTVVSWFEKNHPAVFANPDSVYKKTIKVEVDFSKLDQIRSESAEIQDKLIVSDEYSDECASQVTVSKPEGQTQMYRIHHTEQEPAGSWAAFVSHLTKDERQILLIILEKQLVSEKLAQFALNNQLLIEVILEKINETALECMGDNIIDTGDNPVYVYDEYAEELFRVLKEVE